MMAQSGRLLRLCTAPGECLTDFFSHYTVALTDNLPVWIAATQDRIIELTGRYACAVTAYFTVAGLYGLVDVWQDGGEYLKIWDYTGTV